MAITSADYGLILMRKFPAARPLGDYRIVCNQGNYTLEKWDEGVMGVPRPTFEQILAWGEAIGEAELRNPTAKEPAVDVALLGSIMIDLKASLPALAQPAVQAKITSFLGGGTKKP